VNLCVPTHYGPILAIASNRGEAYYLCGPSLRYNGVPISPHHYPHTWGEGIPGSWRKNREKEQDEKTGPYIKIPAKIRGMAASSTYAVIITASDSFPPSRSRGAVAPVCQDSSDVTLAEWLAQGPSVRNVIQPVRFAASPPKS